MTANTASEKVWAAIDDEKRRDKFIRRVCKSAWIVTIVVVLLLGAIYGVLIAQMIKLMGVGAATWLAVAGAATRVFIVIGILSVLVATLSTVGIFLRMRTTSLTEIQLRLAALEEMVSTRESA
jgi:hypothetical protein